MEKEIVTLAKKLISIPSTKDRPEELENIVNFCGSYIEKSGVSVKRFEKNGKFSLVASLKGIKKPGLMMVGHLDVVEAEEKQFLPRIEKKRLYGRGAKDMKGSVAVMMVLMKELSALKGNPSVGLMLTTDEEVGGFDGAKYLLEKKGYSCDLAFIPDGGSNFEVINSEKGIVHFRMSAAGKASHGSRPWEGENAIDKLIEDYQRLRRRFPNPRSERQWKISLNAGKISGGDAANKIADWAEMILDLRYPEKFSEKEIIGEIRKTVKNSEIEILVTGSCFYVPRDNYYLKKYSRIARNVLKRETVFKRHCGGSDARFFSEKNIPAIITEPPGGGVHGKNEWVSLKGLRDLYEIAGVLVRQEFMGCSSH